VLSNIFIGSALIQFSTVSYIFDVSAATQNRFIRSLGSSTFCT